MLSLSLRFFYEGEWSGSEDSQSPDGGRRPRRPLPLFLLRLPVHRPQRDKRPPGAVDDGGSSMRPDRRRISLRRQSITTSVSIEKSIFKSIISHKKQLGFFFTEAKVLFRLMPHRS